MKSCLIVDDSTVVRMVSKKILEDLGFETSEAANGLEAIELCTQSMPDGVLLDWNMPVKSGIEFLRELRAMPGGDVPKVVFCTTENDIDHITEALETGANEYVMKPFDREIIHSKFLQIGLIEE